MISNVAKASLLKNAVRGLANASACATPAAPVGGYSDYFIDKTILSNKIIVASAENDSLISRVSIVFRAGSRYETIQSLGTAHVLRIAAGLSTKSASQFAIIRNVQEVGASLTCSVDRETITYTLEGTRSAVQCTLPILKAVAVEQCFKPWEVSDNVPRLRLELATRPPQLRAIDLLHKAAYHSRGLGHSIYIAKYNLDKISPETLQYHVQENFTGERCAVVGLGINHQDLVNFADCLDVCVQGCAIKPSQYKGGEIRSDKGGQYAHIAIAGEGASLENLKEALTFSVLQRTLGAGTYIKYANENNSPFAKLIPNTIAANTINAFNVSYSDSGLFGALISAESGKAGDLLEGVIKTLKQAEVSSADFERGKRQTQTAITLAYESGSNGIVELGNSAVLVRCPINLGQILKELNCITQSDVNRAAAKIARSNLSIASVGNLSCVPFLDEVCS